MSAASRTQGRCTGTIAAERLTLTRSLRNAKSRAELGGAGQDRSSAEGCKTAASRAVFPNGGWRQPCGAPQSVSPPGRSGERLRSRPSPLEPAARRRLRPRPSPLEPVVRRRIEAVHVSPGASGSAVGARLVNQLAPRSRREVAPVFLEASGATREAGHQQSSARHPGRLAEPAWAA